MLELLDADWSLGHYVALVKAMQELHPWFSSSMKGIRGYESLNYILPLLGVFGGTIVLHLILGGRGWTKHRKGLWPLVIGKDRHVSTSKVQVAIWTYAVISGLLLLFAFGKDFAEFNWDAEYLLLLGSPAAAALLAKGFTATKVAEGELNKPKANAPKLKDVFTDDDGTTDIFDFQYLLFNLLLLVIFSLELWRTLQTLDNRLTEPGSFLPPLPLAIVALTSVSAAAYAAKKGLVSDIPTLTGAYPSTAAPHDLVTIIGRNLINKESSDDTPSDGTPSTVRVAFGGREAKIVDGPLVNGSLHEIKVQVPATAEPGPAPLRLTTAQGGVTEDLPFEVLVGGPKIFSVNPGRVVLGASATNITISGTDFGPFHDDHTPSNRPQVILDGYKLTSHNYQWSPERIQASIPSLVKARSSGFPTVPGNYELVIEDLYGRTSEPETVEIAEIVPVLTGVYPPVRQRGESVRVLGKNLTKSASDQPPMILFGNRMGISLTKKGEDEFEVVIPEDIDSGPRNVKFVRADGAVSNELDFQIVDG